MMANEESLPDMDDVQAGGPTEQELLDAVMANSMLAQEAGISPLPEEEVYEEDPVESDEEEPEAEDEIENEVEEEDDEEEVEAEDEDAADEDEAATQEAEVYTADDLDLDAKVAVKIDGEDIEVSFGDLIKGYTTEQSLSKKGRELGEARKALDEEREAKLKELELASEATAQMLTGPEEQAAKRYHDLEKQIAEARANGDTYELTELKDKREQAQAQYWNLRNRREQLMGNLEKQKAEQAEKEWQAQMTHFAETIPNLIPDFDENLAMQIRDFAVEEGIDQAVLDTVTDPTIIKFVDDYRRLKQGVSKGKAKRKAAPVKKALPTKKARSVAEKKTDKAKALRNKVMSGQGSDTDNDAFLKSFASQSLSKL